MELVMSIDAQSMMHILKAAYDTLCKTADFTSRVHGCVGILLVYTQWSGTSSNGQGHMSVMKKILAPPGIEPTDLPCSLM